MNASRFHNILPSIMAVTLVVTLAACGGGGGSPMTGSNGVSEAPGNGMMPGDGQGDDMTPGDGSGSTEAPPVREGGHAEAAVSLPIAGSVTQSSDSIGGVTANSVEASISLDSKGLLTADVRGVDWRISTEPAPEGRWHHFARGSMPFAGASFSSVFINQEQGGNSRQSAILTDRALPPETSVRAGDVWVSLERYDNNVHEFWSAANAGVPGTLNGENGTLLCCFDGAGGGAGSAPVIEQPPGVEEDTTNYIGSGEPYTLAQSDTDRGYTFIRQFDAQNAPQDTDYLILGFWLYVPEEWLDEDGDFVGTVARAGGDIEYGVFANGSDPFEQDRIRALTGTATYRGSAFAAYVDTNIYPDTGEGEDSFLLAEAQLTANFADGNSNGTVSGNITNFLDVYSGLTRFTTALALQSAPIGNDHSGFFTGDTAMTIAGSSFAGKWGGAVLRQRSNGRKTGLHGRHLRRGYCRRKQNDHRGVRRVQATQLGSWRRSSEGDSRQGSQ